MRIELLWFDGCPNHEAARRDLEGVLAARGIDAAAVHLVQVDEESAEELRFPGSPTIRVDGRDVEPAFRDAGSYALSCRVYVTPSGARGTPPVEWIERAIDAASSGD